MWRIVRSGLSSLPSQSIPDRSWILNSWELLLRKWMKQFSHSSTQLIPSMTWSTSSILLMICRLLISWNSSTSLPSNTIKCLIVLRFTLNFIMIQLVLTLPQILLASLFKSDTMENHCTLIIARKERPTRIRVLMIILITAHMNHS